MQLPVDHITRTFTVDSQATSGHIVTHVSSYENHLSSSLQVPISAPLPVKEMEKADLESEKEKEDSPIALKPIPTENHPDGQDIELNGETSSIQAGSATSSNVNSPFKLPAQMKFESSSNPLRQIYHQ